LAAKCDDELARIDGQWVQRWLLASYTDADKQVMRLSSRLWARALANAHVADAQFREWQAAGLAAEAGSRLSSALVGLIQAEQQHYVAFRDVLRRVDRLGAASQPESALPDEAGEAAESSATTTAAVTGDVANNAPTESDVVLQLASEGRAELADAARQALRAVARREAREAETGQAQQHGLGALVRARLGAVADRAAALLTDVDAVFAAAFSSLDGMVKSRLARDDAAIRLFCDRLREMLRVPTSALAGLADDELQGVAALLRVE
jgi:hypothetical protein